MESKIAYLNAELVAVAEREKKREEREEEIAAAKEVENKRSGPKIGSKSGIVGPTLRISKSNPWKRPNYLTKLIPQNFSTSRMPTTHAKSATINKKGSPLITNFRKTRPFQPKQIIPRRSLRKNLQVSPKNDLKRTYDDQDLTFQNSITKPSGNHTGSG
ncbi:hypothetical protein H5410_047238 [Solanum commersonii]|uniref:Uncharacterized protein n=1 Tax=Solanum commersonii TaxID=4109 RepID=A0A9J5XHQ1_SOLCO|nr:hypothetical protein H5410_047238 [Solanum commersonii]